MATSTLRRLVTLENLRWTWDDFYRQAAAQTSSGVDDVTPAEFQRHAERQLAKLREELNQGYKFSPLRAHRIPKKDGETFRIICVPTVRDRIVQRLLARHLTQQADVLGIINEASFGFMRSSEGLRRGVAPARDRAIALRNSHRWAYKSDITSFFDRILREDLVKQTIRTLRAPSLRKLLFDAASCEIDDRDPSIARILQRNGIQKGLGIRQGMPLSPILSNVVLRPFDGALIKAGCHLVRYADDFVVFADSEKQCLEIDEFARSVLYRLKLELPPLGTPGSKTRIVDPDSEIEFLGLALAPDSHGTYELVITQKQFEKIGRELGQLKNVKQLALHGIDFTRLVRIVDNKIASYSAAYDVSSNAEVLRRLLEGARGGILRSIFSRAFGNESVEALSSSYRQFFRLDDRFANARPYRA
ncbi:MAG TPA: reverse transcriptase domain-containing protein [Stellaceae bacterium]|nr:reverse transcriptase domain-containing protein [Stellaceae bacterium]